MIKSNLPLDEITQLYNLGKSTVDISKIYGVSSTTVGTYLKKSGIYLDPYKSKKCFYNKKYFNKENLQNSYWAGFILADGSISKKDSGVRLALHRKDKHHLETFSKDIGYSGEVKDYVQSTNYKDNAEYSKIDLYCKEIQNDLASIFKITVDKTKSGRLPNLHPDNLFSFVCGLIDGDGSIQKRDEVLGRISLLGNKDLMQDVGNFLTIYLTLNENDVRIYTTKKLPVLNITRRTALEKFRNRFMEIKKELPYLERKWDLLINADFSNKHHRKL